MRTSNLLIALTSLILIYSSGCTGIHRTQFDGALRENIKTIGILEIKNPDQYDCHDINRVARRFGIVGGLVQWLSNKNRINKLKEALDREEFDFSREIGRQLEAELTNLGYKVSYIPIVRKNHHSFVKNYKQIDIPVDAYLDLTAKFVGFYKHQHLISADYMPHLEIPVRLVMAESGNIVYAELIVYGTQTAIPYLDGCVMIEPDDVYISKKFNDMFNDPCNIVAGMRAGVKAVAYKLALNLK